MDSDGAIESSFRDPSGFIFTRGGQLYRQINVSYRECFDRLVTSGLYDALVSAGLLVPHEEVSVPPALADVAYKVVKPQRIPFISYPYEWCFSELKNAALATLDIQSKALDHGMTLKDASAYNIQFRNAKPVLIDSLSFDVYREGDPWVAYRQFCQHFLAPLAIMAKRDVRLGQLSRVFMDGVPLDMARALLPWRSRLQFGLLVHIHMHAKSQLAHADDARAVSRLSRLSRSQVEPGNEVKRLASRRLKLHALRGIIDSLRTAISKLEWRPKGTEWAGYYDDTNYSAQAMECKKHLVSEFLARAKPASVSDLGANTGVFSRIASEQGALTISFDADPAAVEKNYRECVKEKRSNLLPLVVDLTNPSPSIGWENNERVSLLERDSPALVMALALVHHLAIGNNVPLRKLAAFFARTTACWLIIEFVPKSDSQVRRLLASRKDIFFDYNQEHFEREFSVYFVIEESGRIEDSERTLYLMRRK